MNGTLGGRIAELLTQLNMTQRELAEKVDVTEVSMSRYIKGDRVPKGPVIANIATALHTTTDYLLNGNSSESGDFESEYYMMHRLIAKNVSKMTSKQKRELINALLESEDE